VGPGDEGLEALQAVIGACRTAAQHAQAIRWLC
jgi:hypothetical protein